MLFEVLTKEQIGEMSIREICLSECYYKHNLNLLGLEKLRRDYLDGKPFDDTKIEYNGIDEDKPQHGDILTPFLWKNEIVFKSDKEKLYNGYNFKEIKDEDYIPFSETPKEAIENHVKDSQQCE